ncbi:hypothetical protein CEP53_015031 [Fusarium sp. AF-6]|nr:hypothetical protein CEP53_015031 [Fusarium sp. AF-6]
MLKKQPIIKSYVDLLLKILHEQCEAGRRPLDMVNWFNFTTFDLIGDLAFGEPFGCLETADYHPRVALIFASVKSFSWASNMRRYPSLEKLLMYMVPKEVKSKFEQHNQLFAEKARKRLSSVTQRPDFMDSMTRQDSKEDISRLIHLYQSRTPTLIKRNNRKITFDELVLSAGPIIMAGSGITATLLSAAGFYLVTYPQVLTKLADKVWLASTIEDEIDLLSVQRLPYLLLILDETLCIYPPVRSGSPRRITPGGDVIV